MEKIKPQESQIVAKQNSTTPEQDALLDAVKASLDDHLAEDVVVIELKGKSSIADYMVIASGRAGFLGPWSGAAATVNCGLTVG